MANCPNCGSDHIQLKRETDVNWGRAITGLVLFGVVGGAIGAMTGEDKTANACLDCGTSWKASDLHKMLQLIKKLTDINPDLTSEKDRLFVNRFVLEITPCIEGISEAEKQSAKIIKESEGKTVEFTAGGCGFGCLTSITILFSTATALTLGGFFLLLIMPIVFGFFGMLVDKENKKSNEQEIENTRKKCLRMKLEAEDIFRLKVQELQDSYYM